MLGADQDHVAVGTLLAGLYQPEPDHGRRIAAIDRRGRPGRGHEFLDKAIVEELQADGINAFATSFDQLLATLVHKRRHIVT